MHTTERREHVRHDVDLCVRCRRLGTRATVEWEAETVDLSAGGAQLHVPPPGFGTGDVLLIMFSVEGIAVECKGLVVSTRPAPEGEGRYLHVAFTGLSLESRDRLVDVLRVATLV